MICEKCGIDFEMWMTTNEEWNNVSGNVYNNWCIFCFKKEAENKSIPIDLNKIEVFNKLNPFNK